MDVKDDEFVHGVLAVDLGASSGRAIVGRLVHGKLELIEVHRFENQPVMMKDTYYWDFLRLFHEIKTSIAKAKEYHCISIGVDTWGVDFGLIDEKGRLLENPVHYRDKRTQGIMEECFLHLDKKRFYEITGIQFMELNTVFQLASLSKYQKQMLEKAETLLLMPDLINYMLTGKKVCEYTIAATTQMLDAKERVWSKEVLQALQIPNHLLLPIVPTGSYVGELLECYTIELEVPSCHVVAVAGHDTQCAMAAVPTLLEDFIFISCGTWSLLGTELNQPIVNELSQRYNITNEGGYGGKISFLKNIIGLWLIQESRRQWKKEGFDYSYSQLEEFAKNEEPFLCLIDPDAPEFVAPGNIPKRIYEYSVRTNQKAPKSIGAVVRCINESLALKYRYSLEQIKECTKKDYQTIHVIGGGAQSKLLCQMTANACNMVVKAGPIEATVLGNVAIQMITSQAVKDINEARGVIADSFEIITYTPKAFNDWEAAYQKFIRMMNDETFS